jgi:tripartite-type tricarboxylate transporter receptor subunit TctC
MKKYIVTLLLGIALCTSLCLGAGDVYPKRKAIQIIIPAGAGGNTDLSARVFAKHAEKIFGQSIIVANVNGAGGSIASNQVQAAAPDGYTVLYAYMLTIVCS